MSPANPVVVELVQRVQDTRVFLRMAAVELRRMADRAPTVALELQHVAQQLESEGDDLVYSEIDCRACIDRPAEPKNVGRPRA